MKVRVLSLMLAGVVFLPPVYAEGKSGKWEEIYKKAGISVFRREVEGTSLVEFLGKGVVGSNVVKILAVLSDTDRMKEWVDRSKGIEIIEKIDDKTRIIYSATAAPWPFKDRDFVGKSRMIIDEKNGWIHFQSKETKHAKAPPRGDRVRMPFTRVRWSFKPLGEHKTWIQFKVHADPGGNIPNWVTNLVSKELPYKTIVNLRKRVKSPKVRQEFGEKYKAEYWHWGWDKKYMAELKAKKSKKKKKKKKR